MEEMDDRCSSSAKPIWAHMGASANVKKTRHV